MIVSVRHWVPNTARILDVFLTGAKREAAATKTQPKPGFFESWQKMWEYQTSLVVRDDD